MLTPSLVIVRFNMVDSNRQNRQRLPAQQLLSAQLLEPILTQRRPSRILVLKKAGEEDLVLETSGDPQVIRLTTDATCSKAPVTANIESLPFEENVFDLVILHHVVKDGKEPLLDGVMSVLVPGGDIVISGLNSTGLKYYFGNPKRRLPGIELDHMTVNLKNRSLQLRECTLMGVAGLPWPSPKSSWHGLGLPFADHVALHAHHHSASSNTNVLRFKQVQRAGLTSAALDGCNNRSAAS